MPKGVFNIPYKETKLKSGKVKVTGPSGVHAKGTSKKKADAQIRLLQAKEHNPNFRPRKGIPSRNEK
jgi:hypothetical protein